MEPININTRFYEHSCTQCTYLGSAVLPEGPHDFYRCYKHIEDADKVYIARYGDDAVNCLIFSANAVRKMENPLDSVYPYITLTSILKIELMIEEAAYGNSIYRFAAYTENNTQVIVLSGLLDAYTRKYVVQALNEVNKTARRTQNQQADLKCFVRAVSYAVHTGMVRDGLH